MSLNKSLKINMNNLFKMKERKIICLHNLNNLNYNKNSFKNNLAKNKNKNNQFLKNIHN